MPGDRDCYVAQIGKRLNTRMSLHHDRAGPHRGVEADDLAFTQLLHALDGAPFTHRIDLERALLQLRLLPALGEGLHAAFGALGIVLVIDDVEAFCGKEALLDRDPPGAIMGIAVALKMDGAGHEDACGSGRRGGEHCYASKFVQPQPSRWLTTMEPCPCRLATLAHCAAWIHHRVSRIRWSDDGERCLLPLLRGRDGADRVGRWHRGARLRRVQRDRPRARGRGRRSDVVGWLGHAGAGEKIPALDCRSGPREIGVCPMS